MCSVFCRWWHTERQLGALLNNWKANAIGAGNDRPWSSNELGGKTSQLRLRRRLGLAMWQDEMRGSSVKGQTIHFCVAYGLYPKWKGVPWSTSDRNDFSETIQSAIFRLNSLKYAAQANAGNHDGEMRRNMLLTPREMKRRSWKLAPGWNDKKSAVSLISLCIFWIEHWNGRNRYS